MTSIKSKKSFSWTDDSQNYNKKNFIPVSKIISDIRKLQRLITISTNGFHREDYRELKKDILYLKEEISENILGKEVPSNVSRDYEYLMHDVEERLLEIDKEILG